MTRTVNGPPIEFLIDLINGWAEAVHHEPKPEAGRSYPPLQAFSRHGVAFDAAQPHTELVDVAEDAYRVFRDRHDERLARANELIRSANLSPLLGASQLSWEVKGGSVVRGLAASALLLYAQDDAMLSRLGVCTAHRCCDAYVDYSQARTRRFCGERCQTRAKARRRRERWDPGLSGGRPPDAR